MQHETMFADRLFDEKNTLVDLPLKRESIVVEPLNKGDIWLAAQTWYYAFLDDPMINYISCEEKPSDKKRRGQTLVTSGLLAIWRKTKIVLTVSHGEAVVIETPSKDTRHPIHRFLDSAVTKFLQIFSLSGSQEQKKRRKEANGKIEAAFKEVIGDANDMWYIDLLCTSPKRQGHGYGSALLDDVKERLDQAGKSAWLQSSNMKNKPFYNYHGFFSVADIYLGVDNPKWQGKPVQVQLVGDPISYGWTVPMVYRRWSDIPAKVHQTTNL